MLQIEDCSYQRALNRTLIPAYHLPQLLLQPEQRGNKATAQKVGNPEAETRAPQTSFEAPLKDLSRLDTSQGGYLEACGSLVFLGYFISWRYLTWFFSSFHTLIWC